MNGISISKSWVLRLIFINVAVFFIQIVLQYVEVKQIIVANKEQLEFSQNVIIHYFALTPANIFERFYLWEFVSYMFLHANLWHLVFNMYALFLFGIPIEQAWGSRRFLFYYFFTGIGAGISIFLLNTFLGGMMHYIPTLGASGAVFGVLLAFGILFPDVVLLIFFVIPMKARTLVILYGSVELFLLIFTRGEGGMSHIGHIGGLLFGLLYFAILRKHGIQFKTKMIKAKIDKNIKKEGIVKIREGKESKHSLNLIFQKVKKGGAGALSDDEYQYVRYLEIMAGSANGLCVENDFEEGDEYCKKCPNYEACMIREIKKYL